MEFFDVIRARRSIRKYTQKLVPREVMEKALDAALLAPNSSNLQTWQFFWVRTEKEKEKLVQACLNQSAARTAQELVVCIANPSLWKKTNPEMIQFTESVKAPRLVISYYRRLIPLIYGNRWLTPFRRLFATVVGWIRPITRGPITWRDLQEVSIKSAALACENFMLAITAQGFATCPMEGIDEVRVKKIVRAAPGTRVVMVISVGEADPIRGTWGPQIRFQRDWFVQEI